MKQDEIIDTIAEMLKYHLAGRKQGEFVYYLEPEHLREQLRLEEGDGRGDWSRIFGLHLRIRPGRNPDGKVHDPGDA